MTPNEAISILQKYQYWRRGLDSNGEVIHDEDYVPMLFEIGDCVRLGIAIDAVLLMAVKFETALGVLNQIALNKRKTKEQRLANSCVYFLKDML
jgi:hypothetical protein